MPVINGTSGDDLLTGTDGDDTINGLEGNDTIDGGVGDDVLNGGAGVDVVSYSTATAAVFVYLSNPNAQDTQGAGIDTLVSIEGLEGSAFDDRLVGDAGVNHLRGLAGDDYLIGGDGDDVLEGGDGYNRLDGGAGNDVLIGGSGPDIADYTYTVEGVTVDLSITTAQDTVGAGFDTLTGIEYVIGSLFANDTLLGTSGNDVLDGNGGADLMEGRAGDDIYFVDNAGDVVIEVVDGGRDAVDSSIDYILPANFEILQLNPNANPVSGTGNVLDNIIVGNGVGNRLNGLEGDDQINGLDGDDTLEGGAGNDTLNGGAGVDTASYEHATSGVTVSLGATGSGGVNMDGVAQNTGGAGTDTLYSIENLIGSEHNDILKGIAAPIVGGALGSVLDGRGGDDWLLGSTGFDTLIGGAGWDVLQGGYGNDVYIIADAADHASAEISDNGFDGEFDEVRYTATSIGTLRLFAGDDGIESVRISDRYGVTTGTTSLNVDARAIGNALYLTGNDGANTLRATAFNDHLNGGGGDDYLAGYAGNDTLSGGAGIDRMYGGTGDDTYIVTDATDYTYENAGEGHDTVVSSIDHQLRANVEDLLLADGAQVGRGNELDNHIAGTDGANRLYGDAGNDTLIAKDGDDLLYGGAGNDTLEGDGGYDKMIGGLGDDTYIVTDATDIVYENAGEGTDKVEAFVTHILRANIEQLELFGTDDIRGYGNASDNLIIGNSGSNQLYGRDGNDTLKGGAGNDFLYGENGNDTIEGGSGSDRFYGAAGADTFLFRDGDFGGLTSSNADRLMDFDESQGDVLNLANVDANTLLGGDQAFTFIGSAAFGHHAGELRAFQSGTTTWVQGDTNGDGVADFLIRIDGLHTLTPGGDLVV